MSVLAWLALVGGCAAETLDTNTAKVGAELGALYEAYLAARRSGTPLTPQDPLVPIVEDRVIVDAVAVADVATLRADLAALGMRAAVSAGRVVSGELPIAAIGALPRLSSLKFVRAAASTTHQGGKGRSPE